MEWLAVNPCSKLPNEIRKSEKSSVIPKTSGALLVAVLVKGALMGEFFDIAISIWPIPAIGLD